MYKRQLNDAVRGMSSNDFEKYDMGNRVFVAEIELNREPVNSGYFEAVIRNILFEAYDK